MSEFFHVRCFPATHLVVLFHFISGNEPQQGVLAYLWAAQSISKSLHPGSDPSDDLHIHAQLSTPRHVLLQEPTVLLRSVITPASIFIKILNIHPKSLDSDALQTIGQKLKLLVHIPAAAGKNQ